MRILLVAVPLAACISPSAVPTAMHPTATAGERSVGVAVGGAYQKQDETSVIAIPYGEGWIRTPSGGGQLGVNLGSSGLRVGYRYDASSLASGLGFSIEPMVGGAYVRGEDSDTPTSKVQLLLLTAGIVPTLLFPTGTSFGYVSGKLGFLYTKDLEEDDDSNKSYVVGLSAGIGLSEYVSLELAIHRIDDLEDQMTDTPAAWQVVPTIGVRH